MFVEFYFTGGYFADKRIKGNDEGRVVVGSWSKRPRYRNSNTKLFMQFTSEAFFWMFTIVDLSARELPLQRQTHDLTTLSRENLALFFNNCTCYMNVFHELSDLDINFIIRQSVI